MPLRLGILYHRIISTGGLEGYLHRFLQRLQAAGHELTFLTSETDAATSPLAHQLRHLSLRAIPKSLRQTVFDQRARALVPSLRLDAVLGFGRTTQQDIYRAGGGCHRCYHELLPPWKKYSLNNLLELRLERELCTSGRTRHIVLNAQSVADQLHHYYGVSRDRLTVIRTPVETERFFPVEASELKARASQPPQLLFISSHHERKGLPTLLRALSLIPEARLHVVGRPLTRAHWQMIDQYRLRARVQVLGQVREVAALFRRADVFVHPSRYDACANTVLQALASGVPSIVSRADGAHELIEPGQNGWILDDPTSADELVTHLRAALALNHHDRLALGEKARAQVLPLSWEAHLQQWMALIEKVKAEKSSSPCQT